jgi:hypothetical protein
MFSDMNSIRIHVQGRGDSPGGFQRDNTWLMVTCSNLICSYDYNILRGFHYHEMRHNCDQYKFKIQVFDTEDTLNMAAAAFIQQATFN